MYEAIVRNIAIVGETNVEKKRMSTRSENNFNTIPIRDGRRRLSIANPLKTRSPRRRRAWKATIANTTIENPRNFPMNIDDRETGFESIR